jgi:guanylate kinase
MSRRDASDAPRGDRSPAGDDSTPRRGLLVVIVGPSGVGKSTIAHAVEQRLGGTFSISMTTRPKTAKDRENVDYQFVDEARFRQAIESGELLEWAKVFDHYYGTPKAPVERQLAAGELVILEIDVEGAIQVREHFPDALLLFILPPTMEALLERLRARGREPEEAIQRRYREHKREIERAQSSGAFDAFLVNEDLERTIQQAMELIAERRAGQS